MIYYADMSRGPGGICHLEVSSIGSSTCLDVRVGFVALNVSGVFDVVFVIIVYPGQGSFEVSRCRSRLGSAETSRGPSRI